jgi:hypothetical protein
MAPNRAISNLIGVQVRLELPARMGVRLEDLDVPHRQQIELV